MDAPENTSLLAEGSIPLTDIPPKCLNELCNEVANTRGLCKTCMYRAWSLIKKGLITQEELVKKGKMLPKKPTRGISEKTLWFLK